MSIAPAAAADDGIVESRSGAADRWRRGLRLFATSADAPRARRAPDLLLLVAGLAGLAMASPLATPLPGFAQAVGSFAATLPDFLDGLWQLGLDVLALLAVYIVVAAAVRRRTALVRDLLVAVAVAAALWLVLGRLIEGSWPALGSLRSAGPPPWYPSPRLALPTAVVMTASPHLIRPMRRLGRWCIALAAIGATVLGVATPLGVIAGVLVAVVAAATTHLIFGSGAGRPSLRDVESSLAELGVAVRAVGVATRQDAGVFVVDAVDHGGEPLVVKVYGRDAHDTAVVATLWRSVWYREQGSQISLGRLQQVEREALLTLLAVQAGVPTDRVVTAGETETGDALLVLRPCGHSLDWGPGDGSGATHDDPGAPHGTSGGAPSGATVAAAIWAGLARLHDAGVVHGQIDDRSLVVRDDAVGFADFRRGSVAPTLAQRRIDQAQALVATVLGAGEAAALAVARDTLGPDELAAVLPYVQRPSLTPGQRTALRAGHLDLDDLRARAAEVTGAPAPELEQLRRLSLGSIVRVALPAVAVVALLSAVAGIDVDQLVDALRDASWTVVAAGVVLGQIPRLTQAVSMLGASPVPLPLGPVYALQLAVSYVNLAVPSMAGRIAVNIRFFQRHGVGPGQAVAVGALDGVSGFVVQASLLAVLLLASPVSLDLELDLDSASRAVDVLLLVVALALGAVAAVAAIGPWRRAVLGWGRHYAGEALAAVRGLRSTRRLALLVGGNLATEVLFASTLAVFTAALGFRIGLGEALLINIGVGLLSGLLPVPGGIGVTEGGLTFGLISVGMPEEAAFGAVMLYRLATFYVPPVWGFFAMRWLQRNQHL